MTSDIPNWAITLGLIVASFYVIALIWSKIRPQRDHYAEWLAGVMRDNPDFVPPAIRGPNGRWIDNPAYNPAYTPGQVIVHRDESTS